MKITLCGTRSFGVAVLETLIQDGHDVNVVCPDEDKLKHAARRNGVRWASGIDPDLVRRWDTDLIVGAHSHDFIGRKSRAASKLGALGYHPSLLPRHRGKDAVEWTIRMGDPVAGGTVYWFTDNIDGGPIAAQKHVFVRPGETASELWAEKLFPLGVELLRGVVAEVADGWIYRKEQNEAYATWEPSIDRPPLFRPELPAIGTGPDGFRVVAARQ
jgi:methionyl-tRNA formyltransferase